MYPNRTIHTMAIHSNFGAFSTTCYCSCSGVVVAGRCSVGTPPRRQMKIKINGGASGFLTPSLNLDGLTPCEFEPTGSSFIILRLRKCEDSEVDRLFYKEED